jgi:K+-transporting ATPase ATPase A chain
LDFTLVVPTVISELNGNPAIEKWGLPKQRVKEEVRFGPAISGFWEHYHRNSTGSVNSMHDSSMPVSGSMQLLAMMVNAFMVVAE